MSGFLKRTTAIAAVAALPFSATAVAQSASGETPLVPSDENIKVYKSQRETAPEKAEVTRTEEGEYVERSSDEQGQAAQDKEDAAEATASEGQAAEGEQTELTDEGDTPEVFQGQSTEPGVVPGSPPAQEQATAAEDVLIATVGEAEIRRSDVLDAIMQLPPQLQQQPAEMLIPLAVDQLVTRELILQEAREAGLAEDEEVTKMLSADAAVEARENAMVQVWLRRQLEDRVTEEKVSQAYETMKAQFGAEAPPLEDVRPQIESELRQQAFAEISGDLQADAEITVYGPDGQPVTQ